MIEPLVVEFSVAAPVEHAFAMWVDRIELWWPNGHTVTGDPAAVRFEAEPGGRIYEVAADGTEHDWGEVTAIDAPSRLVFEWHLIFPRAEATTVEMTFTPDGDRTTVRLVQSGFERLGDAGADRRAGTVQGWANVTRHYIDRFPS